MAPEEIGEPFSGLGLSAMERKVGKQGLGSERRWLGQPLVVVSDV
jgi:hypothetical protein